MGQVLNKATEADAIAGTDDSRYMTPAVAAAAVAGLLPIIVTQQSQTSGSMWGPRDGAGLHFIGNTAYMFGGWGGAASDTNWGSGVVTNQVYRTTDFGVTWTRVRDHNATPDATHFVPGHALSHASLTVSGTEYLYLFGGDPSGTGEYLHGDTRRTTDGITWTKVNSVAAGWQYISLSAGGSLNGNLYRAGGINSPGGTPNLVVANNVNSVWRSTDNGVTWSNLGKAPWPAGLTQDHLPEFLGKLWRIGGGTYDNDNDLRTFDNAVWSFNGTTWTEVLANGLAPWAGRQFANAFVFDGWLYISRGFNTSNLSDTWRTRNGIDWVEVDLGLPASHADSVAVNGTGVLVATGNYYLGNNVNGNSPSYLISADNTASLADGVAALIAANAGSGTDYIGIINEGYTEGTSPRSITPGTNNKLTQVQMPHRISTEEPVLLIGGYSYSGANAVYIGGGVSAGENAATEIYTYLAANATTPIGTLAELSTLTGKAILKHLVVGGTTPPASNFFEVRNPGTTTLLFRIDATNITPFHPIYFGASGELTAGPSGSLKIGSASAAYVTGPSGQMIFGEDAGAFYVCVGLTTPTKSIYVGQSLTTLLTLAAASTKICSGTTTFRNSADTDYGNIVAGNIGIGTASPGATLDVRSNSGGDVILIGGGVVTLKFGWESVGGVSYIDEVNTGTIKIKSGGVETVRIDNNSSANDTGLLLLADGTMKRVVMGAADSGGTGYRMLRVAN